MPTRSVDLDGTETAALQSGRRGDDFTPEEASVLLRTRVISGALMSGVATFAGVAAYLASSGTIGGTLPPAAHNFLHVAFIGAVAAMAATPALGRVVARGAPGGPQAFLVATLVKQALREGVGLAGILFAMLAGHFEWILAFAAASLLAMGLGWPRAGALRETLRERRSRAPLR
jgi:hypothetical protein